MVKKVFLIIFSLILVTSCSLVEKNYGNLNINIKSETTRLITPDIDLEIEKYIITGRGGQKASTFEVELSQEDRDSIVVDNLYFGSWIVDVKAYNEDDELLYQGSAETQVDTGETIPVYILISPVEGYGSIDLEVEWNPDDIINPSVEGELLGFYGESIELLFNEDEDDDDEAEYSCEMDEIPTGYYTLLVRLKDAGLPVRGSVEIVRIMDGAETEGEFEFSLINSIDGTIGPIKNPIDVNITGAKDKLFPGDSMVLEASVSPEVGEVVFIWYVDGSRVGVGSELTINNEDFIPGYHDIAVTAYNMDGSRAGIKKHSYRNLPNIPSTSWQMVAGGFNWDKAYKIIQTNDGGYLIAGTSMSTDIAGVENSGGYDAYIVKVDYMGNIEWQKMFGGESEDLFTGLTIGSSGEYILSGTTLSSNFNDLHNNGLTDSFIISLDSEGNEKWSKVYGSEFIDIIYSVEYVGEKRYLFTGTTGADSFTGLIDEMGDAIWITTYGGNGIDVTNSSVVTSDGSFITTGFTTSSDLDTPNSGFTDFYINKISKEGEILWQKCVGEESFEQSYSVSKTSDGNIILAGSSSTTEIKYYPGFITGFNDVYIVKMNEDGDKIWSRKYGGSLDDTARSIKLTSDDGFIIAGFTLSNDLEGAENNGYYDAYLLKLDSNGNREWQKTFGGTSEDRSFDVIETSDKGYAVAGYTYPPGIGEYFGCYDYYIIKLKRDGILD